MPNIILTNICNLSCPYCFASSLKKSDTVFINNDTLEMIVNFLLKSNCGEVGLIGGEPTLHPEFIHILKRMTQVFRKVFVYTNGIDLKKYFPDALSEKICFLVNINEKSDIGEKYFDSVEKMLDMALSYGMIKQFSLGINIYKDNQQFDDVLYLCKKYNMSGLRISVVVPPDGSKDRFVWFYSLKNSLINLYKSLREYVIIPKYDCNIVPSCVFDNDELSFLKSLPGYSRDIMRITGQNAVCRPVIDIFPDLSVARCFGMNRKNSRHMLTDYETLNDIISAFIYEIDGRCLYNEQNKKCLECYKRRTMQCYGGCLKFMENQHA